MPPPPPTFVVVQPPMSPFGSTVAHQYVLPAPIWWHDQYITGGASGACQTRIDFPPYEGATGDGGSIFPKHK